MKFLIIQTAFPGDVILATSVVEKLHQVYPASKIDFLLRKGNESILAHHPFLNNVLVLDKKKSRVGELLRIVKLVRKEKYNHVFNLHRFASSGFIAAFSGAKNKSGFDKNPLSFLFTKTFKHVIPFPFTKGENSGKTLHEIERNHQQIAELTGDTPARPKLYPSEKDVANVSVYKNGKYVCIAPSSVWFTKQWPVHKWAELISLIPSDQSIYLLGAPADFNLCEEIKTHNSKPTTHNCVNLAGKLSFLESAALMKDAVMNYTNDSAPLHLASAMNAPVTAVFCSTIPEFGFTPLSDRAYIAQIEEELYCRPCTLHGKKACPEKHFKCAESIKPVDVLHV